MEYPARGPFEGHFIQDNASPLWVTSRPPFKLLEGVLKWHTLLEHTAQGIQVNIIPPTLRKYFPTPLLTVESVNNKTHTCRRPCIFLLVPSLLPYCGFLLATLFEGALIVNNTDTLAGDPSSLLEKQRRCCHVLKLIRTYFVQRSVKEY